jgi:hypothetical protein
LLNLGGKPLKVAIMQPYYFPYLGYWQLLNKVDIFVVYDDAQYMKGGWVNRNRILVDGKIEYITIPLKKASHKAKIIDREFKNEFSFEQHKEQILRAYKDFPQIGQIILLLESIDHPSSSNLSDFLYQTILVVANLINIKTKIIKSSSLLIDNDLSGQEKVVEICKRLNADEYINPIGGRELYSRQRFNEEGIKLKFLQKKTIEYQQLNNPTFIDNLSILDLLASNPIEVVNELLSEFDVF